MMRAGTVMEQRLQPSVVRSSWHLTTRSAPQQHPSPRLVVWTDQDANLQLTTLPAQGVLFRQLPTSLPSPEQQSRTATARPSAAASAEAYWSPRQRGAWTDRGQLMHSVLVVDDDAAIRSVLGEVLRDQGYAVLEAANGADGVRLAAGAQPDLIMMDLRMPVMTGLEAIEALKGDTTTRAIPILAMSAETLLTAEVGHRHLAVAGLIDKPFDLAVILRQVAQQVA